MSADIVIIRDGEKYRLLHGHLRLSNVLRTSAQVQVEVKGEGQVHITKTREGYAIAKGAQRLPLHPN